MSTTTSFRIENNWRMGAAFSVSVFAVLIMLGCASQGNSTDTAGAPGASNSAASGGVQDARGNGGATGVGGLGASGGQQSSTDAGSTSIGGAVSGRCQSDADCTAPPTDPPGCAEAVCDTSAGKCLVRSHDSDGDTFRDAHCASTTGTPVTPGSDCDDNVAAVHPGATEECNGRDDNCDGNVDEGVPPSSDTCTRGLGECRRTGNVTCVGGHMTGCSVTAAAPMAADDRPNCDTRDYNCDGMAGTGCACTQGQSQACNGECNASTVACTHGVFPACPASKGKQTWCPDLDGDGYPNCKSCVTTCDTAPAQYIAPRQDNACDCDDAHAMGTETCNTWDDDCNPATPEPAQRCNNCGDVFVACGQLQTCAQHCPAGLQPASGGGCQATTTYGYFSFGQDSTGAVDLGTVPSVAAGAQNVVTHVEIDIGIPVACGNDGGGGCCDSSASKVIATFQCAGGPSVNVMANQFNTGRTTIPLVGCAPGAAVRLLRVDNAWTACASFTCCGCGCARRFYETRMTTTADACSSP